MKLQLENSFTGIVLSITSDRLIDVGTADAEALRQSLTSHLLAQYQAQPQSDELQRLSLRIASLVGKAFIEILAKLVDHTTVENAQVRQMGVKLLVATSSEYAAQYLVGVLFDPDCEIRQEAMNALKELERLAGIPDDQIGNLVAMVGVDEAYRSAAQVLLAIKCNKVIPLIIAALHRETHARVRTTLRFLLWKLGEYQIAVEAGSSVPDISEKLFLVWSKIPTDKAAHSDVLDVLNGDFGAEKRCFELLTDIAAADDEELARTSIQKLQLLGEPDALPILSDIAINSKQAVAIRLAGIRAMYTLDAHGSVPTLIELLHDTNWRIHDTVLDLLKAVGREAVDYLLPCLQSEDVGLKRDVIRLLGIVSDRRVVPHLLVLASDADWSVRCASAWAMGMIGDISAAQELEKLSHDRHPFVRQQAINSSAALQGRRMLTPVSQQRQPSDLLEILTADMTKITPQRPSFLWTFVWRIQGRNIDLFASVTTDAENLLIHEGLALLREEQYLQAAINFGVVLDRNKGNALVYLYRAYALWRANRYNEALADCDSATHLKPNWAVAYVLRARIDIALMRIEAAIANAEKALTLDPDSPVVKSTLADAYLSSFRFRDAETLYLEVLDLNGRLIGAHLGLARLHMLDMRLEDALSRVNTAIDLAPNYGASYMVRAAILMMAGRFDLANVDLDTAIETEPNLAIAYVYKAMHELLFGTSEQSEKYCQLAIEIDPYCYTGSLFRVFAWTLQGRVQEALNEYDRIVRIFPQQSFTYLYRAMALILSDKPGLALDDLNLFISAFPEWGLAYVLRAGIYYTLLNHTDLARRDIDKAIQVSPHSAFVYAYRSNLSAGEGCLDEALRDTDQAIQLAPGTWMYYWQRAWLYLRKRNLAEAEKDLFFANSLYPGGRPILDAYVSLYAAQGQYAEASVTLEHLAESTRNPASIGLKRGFLMLCQGDFDNALCSYTQHSPQVSAIDLDIAAWDLELVSDLHDEQREQIRKIIQAYQEPNTMFLDLKSELSTIAPLLAW